MFETLVLLVIAIAMAHKGYPKKGRYSLRMVKLNGTLVLGTLANVTVGASSITGVADGSYRMISVRVVWTLKNLTASQGPLTVGFAHSDYSVTEVKEAIESAASINIGDKVANEQSNRLVRVIGSFSGNTVEESLNDGKPIKTRLNWAIPIGQSVNAFAYNDSGAALTTGAIIDLTGACWVKDNL